MKSDIVNKKTVLPAQLAFQAAGRAQVPLMVGLNEEEIRPYIREQEFDRHQSRFKFK